MRPFDTKDVPAPFSPESEMVGPEDRIHDEDDTYYSFYVGKIPQDSPYRQVDEGCVDAVCNYLKTYAASNQSKPFFIYCTLALPHPPYACADPWYSSIDRDALPPRRPDVATCANRASMLQAIRSKQRLGHWGEERFNELHATYLAMVSQFDSYYGRLSAVLEASGLARDTDVLVWSDHGDYTGDYSIAEKVQNCFEDPVCRVPLIVKPHQGVEVTPRVSSELCELTDIVPTIAELAGVHLSWDQLGVSLVPLLAREVPHRDCVICEGGRLHGEVQAMERGCTPDKRHWPRLSTQESEGPEHTKACMIRMGNLKYTMRLYEDDELYDLAQDPLETVNLVHCERYSEALQALRMRLLKRYMETCDTVPRAESTR